MEKSELNELSNWLKVISEPNRLYLLEKIMQGVQCNCELGSDLDLAPNLISHHLSVLRDAGLIGARRDPKDARWIHYFINRENFEKMQQAINTFLCADRIREECSNCPPPGNNDQKTNSQE